VIKLIVDDLTCSVNPGHLPSSLHELHEFMSGMKDYATVSVTLQNMKGMRTHCDMIHLQGVHKGIVTVQCPLSHCEGHVNRWKKLLVNGLRGKDMVDVIHRRDHSCDVGRAPGEKCCRISKDLVHGKIECTNTTPQCNANLKDISQLRDNPPLLLQSSRSLSPFPLLPLKRSITF
jgi:hypothetical protein